MWVAFAVLFVVTLAGTILVNAGDDGECAQANTETSLENLSVDYAHQTEELEELDAELKEVEVKVKVQNTADRVRDMKAAPK